MWQKKTQWQTRVLYWRPRHHWAKIHAHIFHSSLCTLSQTDVLFFVFYGRFRRIFIFTRRCRQSKATSCIQTRDVARTRDARSPAEPAGCLGLLYFFPWQSCGEVQVGRQPESVPAGSTSLTLLSCYDWLGPGMEDNLEYKSSDLLQLQMKRSIRIFTVMTCRVQNSRESSTFLSQLKDAFVLSGLQPALFHPREPFPSIPDTLWMQQQVFMNKKKRLSFICFMLLFVEAFNNTIKLKRRSSGVQMIFFHCVFWMIVKVKEEQMQIVYFIYHNQHRHAEKVSWVHKHWN